MAMRSAVIMYNLDLSRLTRGVCINDITILL